MSNTLGLLFRVTSFGESHGRCIGVVVDGCPAGLSLRAEDIQVELDRRRPAQSPITSPRAEEDRLEILSGVFDGFTTGAPICMIVWNRGADPSSYDGLRWRPRPGHADYPANVKYGGFNDPRGGGRFSGRITAGYVMAGALAKLALRQGLNVEVLAYTREIGGIKARDLTIEEAREGVEKSPVRCPDLEASRRMEEAIREASAEGDSLGGVVECIVENPPIGLGEPVFDTLEGEISKALYSIPGVKAVEFGLGMEASRTRGSRNNDQYRLSGGRVTCLTNNAGGILGGMSNGMPIRCRAAFKPTPSIRRAQRTVDLSRMEEATLQVGGAHDPCIVPRAVPVVEAMVAVVLVDQAMRAGLIPRVLGRGRGDE